MALLFTCMISQKREKHVLVVYKNCALGNDNWIEICLPLNNFQTNVHGEFQ